MSLRGMPISRPMPDFFTQDLTGQAWLNKQREKYEQRMAPEKEEASDQVKKYRDERAARKAANFKKRNNNEQ